MDENTVVLMNEKIVSLLSEILNELRAIRDQSNRTIETSQKQTREVDALMRGLLQQITGLYGGNNGD